MARTLLWLPQVFITWCDQLWLIGEVQGHILVAQSGTWLGRQLLGAPAPHQLAATSQENLMQTPEAFWPLCLITCSQIPSNTVTRMPFGVCTRDSWGEQQDTGAESYVQPDCITCFPANLAAHLSAVKGQDCLVRQNLNACPDENQLIDLAPASLEGFMLNPLHRQPSSEKQKSHKYSYFSAWEQMSWVLVMLPSHEGHAFQPLDWVFIFIFCFHQFWCCTGPCENCIPQLAGCIAAYLVCQGGGGGHRVKISHS